MKSLFTFCLLFVISLTAIAQEGYIRGTLVDQETQEPLIGGVVTIEDTQFGAVTDIDGSYSIKVPNGVYAVNHSYIGYEPKIVTDVTIEGGNVNALGVITLGVGGEASDLEAVVVTAFVQKNSEEGLLNFQRESTKMINAISAQSIAKTGDSDVAAVVRRIPGVTVEGGKYVYVRGLGDRYSKSILNGMEIPGLDPERNTVQMDIFPSNIIDNIVVYKTFSPDLSGDFVGGMVDVVTKDFPQEKSFNVGVGTSFNTLSTFSDSYISADFSTADMVGFGNASRQIPFSKYLNPNQASRQTLSEATNALNKETAYTQGADNFLNQSLNLSYGNQYVLANNNKIGFTTALNYKRNYGLQQNWERNDLAYANNEVILNQSQFRAGSVGTQDGMLNGILNAAYKFDNGKVGVKLMHTRTGEGNVSFRRKDDTAEEQIFDENIIDYFQRSISNGVIESELYLGTEQEMVLSGALSGSYSNIENPERTTVEMFIDESNGDYLFNSNSNFTKEWRTLEENSLNGKLDFEMPIFKQRENRSMAKFGLASNYKIRGFEPVQVKIAASNPFDANLINIPNNNLDYILQNVATVDQEGYIINDVKVDFENKFYSNRYVNAAYAMTDYDVNEKLKFIGGLRVEQAIMNFAGYENETRQTEETLNSVQFLPSANVVYEMKDYMNLRTSYNRTLARPSFKEKSNINLFDAILNQFFIGNIDLVETTVDNYDLRWEYYFDSKEMVSLSPFFKQFQNPIELSFINNSQVKPINKEDAQVLGLEAEFRKDFGFINESWEDVMFNGNLTLAHSMIDFTPNERLKYDGNAPSNRQLVGQSPYTINAGFTYQNPEGYEGSIGYNVKGKTLNIVGFTTTNYDVFEDPFHNLDLKVSKKLGGKLDSKISLTAGNLLNDNIDYYYDFDGQRLGTFQSYDIGQTFNLGYSINLK